jgi:hypothetical protein
MKIVPTAAFGKVAADSFVGPYLHLFVDERTSAARQRAERVPAQVRRRLAMRFR